MVKVYGKKEADYIEIQKTSKDNLPQPDEGYTYLFIDEDGKLKIKNDSGEVSDVGTKLFNDKSYVSFSNYKSYNFEYKCLDDEWEVKNGPYDFIGESKLLECGRRSGFSRWIYFSPIYKKYTSVTVSLCDGRYHHDTFSLYTNCSYYANGGSCYLCYGVIDNCYYIYPYNQENGCQIYKFNLCSGGYHSNCYQLYVCFSSCNAMLVNLTNTHPNFCLIIDYDNNLICTTLGCCINFTCPINYIYQRYCIRTQNNYSGSFYIKDREICLLCGKYKDYKVNYLVSNYQPDFVYNGSFYNISTSSSCYYDSYKTAYLYGKDIITQTEYSGSIYSYTCGCFDYAASCTCFNGRYFWVKLQTYDDAYCARGNLDYCINIPLPNCYDENHMFCIDTFSCKTCAGVNTSCICLNITTPSTSCNFYSSTFTCFNNIIVFDYLNNKICVGSGCIVDFDFSTSGYPTNFKVRFSISNVVGHANNVTCYLCNCFCIRCLKGLCGYFYKGYIPGYYVEFCDKCINFNVYSAYFSFPYVSYQGCCYILLPDIEINGNICRVTQNFYIEGNEVVNIGNVSFPVFCKDTLNYKTTFCNGKFYSYPDNHSVNNLFRVYYLK